MIPPIGNLLLDLADYFIGSQVATIQQVLLLFGPPLLLAFITDRVTNLTRNQASRIFGVKPFIYGTFVGICVHECAHALACIAFGFKILEFKAFQPTPDGTLGHVTYEVDERSKLQSSEIVFFASRELWR